MSEQFGGAGANHRSHAYDRHSGAASFDTDERYSLTSLKHEHKKSRDKRPADSSSSSSSSDSEDRSRRKRSRSPSSSSSSSSSSDDEKKRKKRHKKDKKKDKKKKDKKSKHKKEKEKKHKDTSDQPMQYSKFLKGVYDSSSEEEGTRRSAISGKKIKMKVERTSKDKTLDKNREQLRRFLNQL